ncbi:MAG TPA: hypothetical protein VIF60_22510 [Burkholderiaceae bacterium]
MTMQSCWSATYVGPHHGTYIKKLERLAGFDVVALERERFIVNEEKIEHSTFLVNHDSNCWQDLVIEILHTAQLIFPVWKVTICGNVLSGEVSRNMDRPNVEFQMRLSGHRSITWKVNKDQCYTRMKWFGSQPDRW